MKISDFVCNMCLLQAKNSVAATLHVRLVAFDNPSRKGDATSSALFK